MSDIQNGQKAAPVGGGKPRRDLMTYALYGLSLLGLAAVLYVIAGAVIKPKAPLDLKSFAHGQMARLEIAANGAPAPDVPVLDASGKTVKLTDLKAPVVVLNLWATWCAPCREEMPALARLQAAYPGRILVVPVSMDKDTDREKARDFIGQHGPLPFYQDPKYALAFALTPNAAGFPTTVLYDHSGHERARLSGGADWNSPEARAVIEALIQAK
ncbi:MAG: TlpA disulfide reductase family protein [Caulobacteraceae bacterium]|nr:TlpA disulfide reductase family protein [Caulobacteraceae bacterium]